MRQINNIVIHCSATPQSAKVSSIVNYWRNEKGWKAMGYHKIIDKDGCVHELATDDQICNGVAGHNKDSLHVCYIGGQFTDDRTDAQKKALREVVKDWSLKYPKARILGHRDFPNVAKACPNFDVATGL